MRSYGHKRIFIGLTVKPQLIKAINEFRTLNAHLENIRWIADRNLHITCCFIGKADIANLNTIERQISEVVADFTPLQLEFNCFELMLKRKRSKMFWAVFNNEERFTNLVKSLHKNILDEEPEKHSIPHITIARFKYLKAGLKINYKVHVDNKKILFDEIVLYESKLSSSSAEYSAIKSWPL